MKLAILGSTQGSDAEFILKMIQESYLKNITVECIISNKKQSGILVKAEKFGIPGIFVSGKDQTGAIMSRGCYDAKVMAELKKYNVDYVLLIGWMKILSQEFIQMWDNKILNIHPSILPAFEGEMDMNIHRAVIERGCKITGATLMFVDDGVDTGPIIGQRCVDVLETDTPESLKQKVQAAEKDLFSVYLPLLRDRRLRVKNKKVVCIN